MTRPTDPPNWIERPDDSGEEPPPVLGTWRRLYVAVIGWLVFLILLFYGFARRYAP